MMAFERIELLRTLDLEESFLARLEREEIVYDDALSGRYSERMVERARIAHSLVTELEVNWSGVAVILQLREDLVRTRSQVRRVHEVITRHARRSVAPRERDSPGNKEETTWE